MHAPLLDHVVSDTAAAIRARWSREDMTQLLFADEREFFGELARAAILGSEEARRKPLIIAARMKNGAPINIQYWDKGDFIPAYDKHNNVFEAFTSFFYCEKFRTSVQVDRFEVEDCGLDWRRACEYNALNDHGVDVNSFGFP